MVVARLPPNYGEPALRSSGRCTEAREKYRVRLLPFLFEGVAPQQFRPTTCIPRKKRSRN
jgi:hypothetical protein